MAEDDTIPAPPAVALEDDEYVVLRTGTLSFEQLTDVVNDHLTKIYPDAQGALLDLGWHVSEKEILCDFLIRRHKDDLLPGCQNREALEVARQVIAANPEVVEAVKVRRPNALNHLVGEVMRAYHVKIGKLELELAFELVVNLLGIVVKQDGKD